MAPQPRRADHRLRPALARELTERRRRDGHTRSRSSRRPASIVDMSWDPITRIVGNLGIYTKIDFDNREVV